MYCFCPGSFRLPLEGGILLTVPPARQGKLFGLPSFHRQRASNCEVALLTALIGLSWKLEASLPVTGACGRLAGDQWKSWSRLQLITVENCKPVQ